MKMIWQVYLSGEIHSDWRAEIAAAVKDAELPIELMGPNTDHSDSDDCGAVIMGEPESAFWRDHMGAKVNAIRTRTLIEAADIVVVRFGEQYRQWNAAFDAGYAAALGKSLIVQHPVEFTHALKEVDGAAMATCETVTQVIEILRYVTTGVLNR
ncbi:YtoQ family protein [Kordiimonas lipolytica]|uniref:YtoQ family protein n=1 Tax=Kordiimonas lipolytica TaxID=1662421 RepID=A0ABV8U7G8_9PROT|nr:YtoQ family protein [Kordiimonas lipolytica]